MEVNLVCPKCRGGTAVVAQRVYTATVGEGGDMLEEVRVPQSQQEEQRLDELLPRVAPEGYTLAYEWVLTRRGERDVNAVRIYWRRDESVPLKPKAVYPKSKAELVEMAARKGIEADMSWTTARLIAAIEGSGKAA